MNTLCSDSTVSTKMKFSNHSDNHDDDDNGQSKYKDTKILISLINFWRTTHTVCVQTIASIINEK